MPITVKWKYLLFDFPFRRYFPQFTHTHTLFGTADAADAADDDLSRFFIFTLAIDVHHRRKKWFYVFVLHLLYMRLKIFVLLSFHYFPNSIQKIIFMKLLLP